MSITFRGRTFSLIGDLPKVGDKAPDFTVTKMDLSEIKLSNYLRKKIILNIFPSLDTSTCAAAMKKFNKIAIDHPDILILCISADLPFAQKRFCGAEHIKNIQPVSTFRHPNFGELYGITITDGPYKGLLARAVIFINEEGTIVYSELSKELTDEPNYNKLLQEVYA